MNVQQVANFDINYRTKIGEVGFALNQLFFYTRLNKPLVLTTMPVAILNL